MRKLVVLSALVILISLIAGCGVPAKDVCSTTTLLQQPTTHTLSAPTQPESTAPLQQTPDIPVLSQDRMALIEVFWRKEGLWRGFQGWERFRPLDHDKEGIRCYGSYRVEVEGYCTTTCDILYIPCEDLPVYTELNVAGYTFRSRTAFGLYIFGVRVTESGVRDVFMSALSTTAYPDPIVKDCQVDEALIADALRIHNIYEEARYGSVIGSMPYIPEDQEYMYRQAQWLAYFGIIADFEDPNSQCRFYGTFDGYDIYFEEHIGGTGIPRLLTLGQFRFTHDGSYGFTMYAIKDGRLYYLSGIYADGLISDEAVAQIYQVHQTYYT